MKLKELEQQMGWYLNLSELNQDIRDAEETLKDATIIRAAWLCAKNEGLNLNDEVRELLRYTEEDLLQFTRTAVVDKNRRSECLFHRAIELKRFLKKLLKKNGKVF